MKMFKHIPTYSVFQGLKISANSNDTQYTVGVDGNIINGVPDIKWQSIAFIKDVQKIWTHGQLYDCSGGGSENIAMIEFEGNIPENPNISLETAYNKKIQTIILVENTTEEIKNGYTGQIETVNNSNYYVLNRDIWSSSNTKAVIFSGIYSDGYENLYMCKLFVAYAADAIFSKEELALKSDIPNTDNFLPAVEKYTGQYYIGGDMLIHPPTSENPTINLQGGIGLITALEVDATTLYTSTINIGDSSTLNIWDTHGDDVINITYKGDGTKFLSDDGKYKTPSVDTSGLATQANLTSAVTQLTTNIAKKQDKLVSGTNIATINGNSILGSGNFDLATTDLLRSFQPKLESGTNIKTINGESILGSGDIEISGGSSDANVQAVDTGDVIDDVTVNYATKSYVDGLVGDINSVLESIINGGGGISLITFTIEGTEQQAEEGMTWGEWVDSDYNTFNYIVNDYYGGITNAYETYIIKYNNEYVLPSDIINRDYAYYYNTLSPI